MEEKTFSKDEESLMWTFDHDGNDADSSHDSPDEQKVVAVDEALEVVEEDNSAEKSTVLLPSKVEEKDDRGSFVNSASNNNKNKKNNQKQPPPPAAAGLLERLSSMTKLHMSLPKKQNNTVEGRNQGHVQQPQHQKHRGKHNDGANDQTIGKTNKNDSKSKKEIESKSLSASTTRDDSSDSNVPINQYDFDSLEELYAPGTKVLVKSVSSPTDCNNVDMVCKVVWNRYVPVEIRTTSSSTASGYTSQAGDNKNSNTQNDNMTTLFKVCFQFLVALPGGEHFTTVNFVQTVYRAFDGYRPISSLMKHQRFVPLSIYNKDEVVLMMKHFRKRGHIYSKYAGNKSGHSFLAYDKNSFFPKESSSSTLLQSSGSLVASLYAYYYPTDANDAAKDRSINSYSISNAKKYNNYRLIMDELDECRLDLDIRRHQKIKRSELRHRGINSSDAIGKRNGNKPSTLSGRLVIDAKGALDTKIDGLSVGFEAMLLSIEYKYGEYTQYIERKIQLEEEEQENTYYAYYDQQTHSSSRQGLTVNSCSSGGNRRTKKHFYNVLSEMNLFDDVPEEYMEMTWPFVVGFSFDLQVWGDVLVDGLSTIENFQDSLVDDLVLPLQFSEARARRMVKVLVRQHQNTKQQQPTMCHSNNTTGMTFLLDGPSGVGKTLTAQAVSDMLHQPLFVASLGQLEIMTKTARLQWIMDFSEMLHLCNNWDAVVLLEEANILFLDDEQIQGKDDKLKAMICVILYLIQSFPGILFLETTNNDSDDFAGSFLNQTFDKKQGTLALDLKFNELSREDRNRIWTYILTECGYKNLFITTEKNNIESAPLMNETSSIMIDTWSLAQHRMNGHEIKKAIHFAICLAREDEKNGNFNERREKEEHPTSNQYGENKSNNNNEKNSDDDVSCNKKGGENHQKVVPSPKLTQDLIEEAISILLQTNSPLDKKGK